MAIKSNRHFNDPAMAQAAANLSSLFEPPSGSDEAGYARARADNLQTGQRQALWDYAQRPDFDRGLVDIESIIADLYDPSQSFQAVDTQAATQKYGYDQSLLGTKYTADTSAATSLANNKLDNLTKLYAEGYDDIGRGETQPAIPLDVLGQYGGTVAVPRTEGAAFPLSETEWIAAQLEEAKGKNEISTGDIADTIIGKETPVMVIMPDGKISYMTPGEAARTGATPVLSSEQQKGQIIGGMSEEDQMRAVLGTDVVKTVGPAGRIEYTPEVKAAGLEAPPEGGAKNLQGLDSYVRKDGSTFVGFADEQGRIHNQNGALEPEAIRKGELPASAQGVVGKPTDSQLRSGFAAKMSEESTKRLLAAYDDPALMPSASDMTIWPTLNQMARSEGITTATIGRFLNDQAMSPAGREFFLNLTNILPYELMQKSGAATTQTDWATSLASAVPQPNDTPTMKQIRKERLETFIKATYGMATGERVVDPAAATATTSPAAAEPAASAPATAAPVTEEEWVRDPVTKKLKRK